MKDIKLTSLVDTGAFVDIKYNADSDSFNYKDIETLEGTERIKQSVVKCLLAERGREPFTGYGSGLQDYIHNGTYPITDPRLLSLLKNDLIQSLSYLIKVDNTTDGDEQIEEITSLSMTVAGSSITITMGLKLASGEIIPLTITENL